MIPLQKALSSPVGKKLVMGLSGLAITIFVIIHLAGNLSLYRADGTTFNLYAHTLESYGLLLTLAEIGLLGTFLVHIFMAFSLTKTNYGARPVGYKNARSKGGPTLSNLSSRNMIITGVVLLGFLVLHVWQFRFNFGQPAQHVTTSSGVEVDDLYNVVHQTFANPLYVVIYVGAMLFLGFHLRHGFWSAFQSLGAMNTRLTKPIYVLGVGLATLLALGFLLIPIWIHFDIAGALK
jgi:succinate dehydrogenase / fumarate reductase cytochrome b subunit